MARYRVLVKSFIGTLVMEPGAEVDYDGKPDENLEPLDEAAKAIFADRLAERAREAAEARAKQLANEFGL